MVYTENAPNKLGVKLGREEQMNVKLRSAREASGKTQAQIAKEVEISDTQYQNIEYNNNEPRVSTAIKIARAVNSTVEELFDIDRSVKNTHS